MNQSQIISFFRVRAFIGVLGIVLPIILLISGNLLSDCSKVQESLSAYYFTNARDYFVGILFITGTLLLTYKGYNKVDNILANIAGLSAIGIAVFPTTMGNGQDPCSHSSAYHMPTLHYISAGVFFISLIIFSMFIFTKTSDTVPPTPQKILRNKVYRTCGWIMIISLVLIAINKFITKDISRFFGLEEIFTFVMEWIFLAAFGISWITKGEVFLKDN